MNFLNPKTEVTKYKQKYSKNNLKSNSRLEYFSGKKVSNF